MIQIIKADKRHIEGIADVCTRGYWATYGETHSKEYIKRVIMDFYNYDRISREVTESNRY